MTSAYGAAGSLVIIVVWVYYTAQILLLGAEFTKVWTKRRGSGFVPQTTAAPVTEEARAEQGLGPRTAATVPQGPLEPRPGGGAGHNVLAGITAGLQAL